MADLTLMLEAIQEVSGYSREMLMGKSREHMLCFSRYCLWHRLRNSGWSYSQIGWRFNRDHATVMNGIRQVENAVGNASYRAERELMEEFQQNIDNRYRADAGTRTLYPQG